MSNLDFFLTHSLFNPTHFVSISFFECVLLLNVLGDETQKIIVRAGTAAATGAT